MVAGDLSPLLALGEFILIAVLTRAKGDATAD
jgi:hypothetical protein